jgi:hypothetical protein
MSDLVLDRAGRGDVGIPGVSGAGIRVLGVLEKGDAMTLGKMGQLALALLLVALSGCGGSEDAKVVAWGDDVDAAVLAQYRAVGPHHVLLVGDSLTAYNPITELCGLPVIKAGYPGGKWAHVAARPIWHLIESDIIIVMLGTNNALKGPAVSHHDMITFLTRLQGPALWIETTPPYFNLAYLPPTAILPGLQETELSLGYPVIDNRERLNSITLFTDGIHLNEVGYKKQNELLEMACPYS